jgi:hypothetical protein
MNSTTEIQQFVLDNPFPSFQELSDLIGPDYSKLGFKNHVYVKILYDNPDDPMLLLPMANCMFQNTNQTKESFTTNYSALLLFSPCSNASNHDIRTHFTKLKSVFFT